jgi:hypothetical protein
MSFTNRPLAVLGLAVLLAFGCDESDSQEAVENFEQELRIDFDGTAMPMPLEAMDVWLTDEPDWPETFEIHGDGIAIVGTFPRDVRVGYGEDWSVLVGRSIPISARGGDPRYEKPSVLTVPGIGQFRVTGGTFTVEKVEAGWNGRTPITGRIELTVRAANGETSLVGSFTVRAMTWG